MQSDAGRGTTGPSLFNRPPQPGSRSTFGIAREGTRRDVPAVEPGPADAARAALEGQRRSGGQWFYWIAGLSLINAVVAFTGQEWRFIIGLGITEVVHQLAEESGGAGMKAGLAGLVVIAIFAALGQRAVRGSCWAFVVGMVLYALDGAIFLLVQDWVGVGFHAFALVVILRGYLAARQLSPVRA